MPVSTSVVLEAPIQTVWGIIGDFQNLMRWHPLVVSCETEGQGEGAVRKVHFPDWWALERLDRFDPENFVLEYSLRDSSRPVIVGVKGSMSLSPDGAGCRLAWVSGLDDEHPHAADVNASLAAYYPVRIGHLRTVLGLEV